MATMFQPIFGSGLDQLAAQRFNWANVDIANRNANIARANQAQQYWDDSVAQNAAIARHDADKRLQLEMTAQERQDRRRMADAELGRRQYEFGVQNQLQRDVLAADKEARAQRAAELFADEQDRQREDEIKIENAGKTLASNVLVAKRALTEAQSDYDSVASELDRLAEQIEVEQQKKTSTILSGLTKRQRELSARLDKDIRPRVRKAETAIDRLVLGAQNNNFDIDEETGVVVYRPTGAKYSFTNSAKPVVTAMSPVMGDVRRADEESMRNYFGGPVVAPAVRMGVPSLPEANVRMGVPAIRDPNVRMGVPSRNYFGQSQSQALSVKFNSPQEVKAAYKAGTISKDQVAEVLRSQFGLE